MPVLHVTFTSREMQQVAGVCSDDLVIHRSPTHNIMGADSAPPKPSGGHGGGFGGSSFGGGGGGVVTVVVALVEVVVTVAAAGLALVAMVGVQVVGNNNPSLLQKCWLVGSMLQVVCTLSQNAASRGIKVEKGFFFSDVGMKA